jgi:uncharacterized protein
LFRNFILKLTGFCNLNCTYCYMFNSADRAFERKPQYMAPETARAALTEIAAHVRANGSRTASIVLHGGEPTLWPLASFRALFDDIAALRDEGLTLNVTLQTNLWQMPRPGLLALLREHRVLLGISLDGPERQNDAFRVDFRGKGSYGKILRNLHRLLDAGYGDVVGGFLCVMQPTIPPLEFLDWIAGLPATRIDLIWPLHYNQQTPPWNDEAAYALEPRYGTWLAELFEYWWTLDRTDLLIRIFQDAIEARLGGLRATDILGARCFDALVINTDGGIEMSDYFRTSRDGATETGYGVPGDTLDKVAADPRLNAMRAAAERLPQRCTACAHKRHCGGGTLAGRLDADGAVTAEPSVLCHDHLYFFDSVARVVDGAIAARQAQAAEPAPVP